MQMFQAIDQQNMKNIERFNQMSQKITANEVRIGSFENIIEVQQEITAQLEVSEYKLQQLNQEVDEIKQDEVWLTIHDNYSVMKSKLDQFEYKVNHEIGN